VIVTAHAATGMIAKTPAIGHRSVAGAGREVYPSHGTMAMMKRDATLPKIVRRRSAVHGFGVFAAERIPRNKRIIDYAGELVRNDESEEREERYLDDGCIWVFRVNRTWSRDANVGGNIARFINHSCTPNCWFEVVDKTIWIRAKRDIRKGEELTYDYSIIGERTIACRCRPGCPNKI
jgi:SET domain-containing protein